MPKIFREIRFHAGWIVLLGIGYTVLMVYPFATGQQAINRKEAEVKQNLHAIQHAVERYAVDYKGVFPNYLIGGTPAQGSGIPGTIPFTSDVLLREGYLTSYPSNPFMRQKNPRSLEMQRHLQSSITGTDPLCPGDPEGDLLGYRFGKNGDIMGQVLCDPRYEKWTFTDPLSGQVEQRDTWAIIEYPFWDTWDGKKHEPEFLPGMFFYKSMGSVIARKRTEEPEERPDEYNKHTSINGNPVGPGSYYPVGNDNYIMGAYGSLRTKGMDIIGDEQMHDGVHMLKWTRSAYSNTTLGGCPFTDDGSWWHWESGGNPNGIQDGMIIFLTTGKDICGWGSS